MFMARSDLLNKSSLGTILSKISRNKEKIQLRVRHSISANRKIYTFFGKVSGKPRCKCVGVVTQNISMWRYQWKSSHFQTIPLTSQTRCPPLLHGQRSRINIPSASVEFKVCGIVRKAQSETRGFLRARVQLSGRAGRRSGPWALSVVGT